MKIKKLLLILIVCFTSLPLFAQPADISTALLQKLSNMEEAEPPQIVEGYLQLSYVDTYPRNYVAVVFAGEDYNQPHYFYKNKNNVYIYLHQLSAGEFIYDYRLVVDGIWSIDPLNDNRVRDQRGIEVSRVISDRQQQVEPYTVIDESGNVTFYYKGEANTQVYLTGNFFNWDPFMLRMAPRPSEPTIYQATIQLKAGNYYYQFIIDGTPIPDPTNYEQILLAGQRNVSILSVN